MQSSGDDFFRREADAGTPGFRARREGTIVRCGGARGSSCFEQPAAHGGIRGARGDALRCTDGSNRGGLSSCAVVVAARSAGGFAEEREDTDGARRGVREEAANVTAARDPAELAAAWEC